MKFLLIISLFGFFSFAESPDQPAKLDDSDFRSTMLILKIVNQSDNTVFVLERSGDSDHYLKQFDISQNVISNKKLSGKVAKEMEHKFSKFFLKLQYETTEFVGTCDSIYELSLKKDSLKICDKDQVKIEIVKSLLESMKSYLKF